MTYRIFSHINDKHYMNQLIKYIVTHTGRPYELVSTIKMKLNNKISDGDIFDIIKNVKIPDNKVFEYSEDNKIQKLKEFIDGGISNKKILDIGTESIDYLKKIDAYGINIKEGFDHYTTEYDTFDNYKKFKFYDGINIPFKDNKFDIITIYSVLHHIPTLQKLIINIKRVLKKDGFIFIKENDITNDKIRDAFNIQHEIYEGAILAGKPSYRNDKFTLKTLLKEFDMKVHKLEYLKNFANVYYLTLCF